jgi:hypothetical protein
MITVTVTLSSVFVDQLGGPAAHGRFPFSFAKSPSSVFNRHIRWTSYPDRGHIRHLSRTTSKQNYTIPHLGPSSIWRFFFVVTLKLALHSTMAARLRCALAALLLCLAIALATGEDWNMHSSNAGAHVQLVQPTHD